VSDPGALNSQTFENSGNETINFSYSLSQTETKSTSFTWSNQHQVGVDLGFKITVDAGIPEVAEVKAESSITLQYSYTRTESGTTSESSAVGLTGTLSGSIKPNSVVQCQGQAKKGTFTSDFTALQHVKMKNGAELVYKTTGSVEAVDWSSAHLSCPEVAISKFRIRGQTKDVIPDVAKGQTPPSITLLPANTTSV
jgi:hypothetical protein